MDTEIKPGGFIPMPHTGHIQGLGGGVTEAEVAPEVAPPQEETHEPEQPAEPTN